MKRKINSPSLLFALVLLMCTACQKTDIYENIDSLEVQKTDPLIAIDRIMDTPVVMGKVILNDQNQVTSGWLIHKNATLHSFKLAEGVVFPTKLTGNSELLVEAILGQTTEVKQVDATSLLLKARQLEEIEHVPPVYRSGESTGNSTIHFTFAEMNNTTCTRNGNPISFVTAFGCEDAINAASLQNCETESSITAMILKGEGQVNAILPQGMGNEVISYMDQLIESSTN